MPLQTNEERNRIIYGLWESGKTVDEIAISTGIPRGTVGYYVRKFNRLARQGISPVFVHKDKKRSPNELAMSLLEKEVGFRLVADMIKAGEFERSYYYLGTMKLMLELRNYLSLDEEKMRAYKDGLQAYNDTLQSIVRAPQSPSAQPTAPRQKTVREIFEAAKPRPKTLEEILRAAKPSAGRPVQ